MTNAIVPEEEKADLEEIAGTSMEKALKDVGLELVYDTFNEETAIISDDHYVFIGCVDLKTGVSCYPWDYFTGVDVDMIYKDGVYDLEAVAKESRRQFDELVAELGVDNDEIMYTDEQVEEGRFGRLTEE
jgi:hypothetical protein